MTIMQKRDNGGQERVVICMKWGTLYSADYVNVLLNACTRSISTRFRFLCLTDNADGLDKRVETHPIPDIGLTPSMWRGGAWPKLSVFMRDLYGLTGRALFIDLDMVINGPLDPFFEHDSPFVTTDMGDGWRPNPRPNAAKEAGTCIFAFNLGEEHQIVDRFVADREAVVRAHTIEQNWVGATASSMAYWPDGWVISFKRFLRRPIGVDLFLSPKAPPKGTKVVAFHGKPRPADLLRPGNGMWDSPPHMGHGQVAWMVDYWKRNGGCWPLA